MRRLYIILALFLCPLVAHAAGGTCPANVPTGHTCYFVSYSAGADTNNGTSEATPLKYAPYMVGCTSNCVSLESTFGPTNGIIFKGGDVWPSSVFPWIWNNVSGSSYPAAYMGYDPTWNNGTVVSITPQTSGYNCSAITVTVGGNATATARFFSSGPWAGYLQHITVTSAGSGYSSNPSVSFAGSTCTMLPTAVADITRPVFDGSGTQWTTSNIGSQNSMIKLYGWNYAEIDHLEFRGFTVSNTVPIGTADWDMLAVANVTGVVLNSIYAHNFGVTAYPQTGSSVPTNAITGVAINGGYTGAVTIQNSFFDNYEIQQGGTENPAMSGGTCGWASNSTPDAPGAGNSGCNQSILLNGATTVTNSVLHDGRGLLYDSGSGATQQYSGNWIWNGLFDAGSQHGDGIYFHSGVYFFNNVIHNINGGSNYLFESCSGSSNCDSPNTSWVFNNISWDTPDSGNTQPFFNMASEFATSSTTWATNPTIYYYNNTCYGSNSGTAGCLGSGQWYGAPNSLWAQNTFNLYNNHVISTQTSSHWFWDSEASGTCTTTNGCGTWNGLSRPKRIDNAVCRRRETGDSDTHGSKWTRVYTR